MRDARRHFIERAVARWEIDLRKAASEKDSLKAFEQLSRYAQTAGVQPGQRAWTWAPYFQKLHEMYGALPGVLRRSWLTRTPCSSTPPVG